MDFNTVITAIGSLGFPIVACILMGYMFLKFTDNYRQGSRRHYRTAGYSREQIVQSTGRSVQIQRERRELLKTSKSEGLYRQLYSVIL